MLGQDPVQEEWLMKSWDKSFWWWWWEALGRGQSPPTHPRVTAQQNAHEQAAVAAHTCRHPPLQRVHVCADTCARCSLVITASGCACPTKPWHDAALCEAVAGLHPTETGGGNSSPNDNKGNNVTKHVHELGMFIWIYKECSHGDLSLWAACVSRVPWLILLVFLLLSYLDWVILIHDPFFCLNFHFMSFTLLQFM